MRKWGIIVITSQPVWTELAKMIVFDLQCLNGHTFEGWFEDKKDLENQQEQGVLACPVCETTSVEKKIHPIAIRKSSGVNAQKKLLASQEVMAELTEKVAEYVEKNYEDVGSSFSKEALKMHYGAEEYRNIRGSTTKEEDKVLKKEGVPVVKVPVIKKPEDDLN
jgi:hypothetical protein